MFSQSSCATFAHHGLPKTTGYLRQLDAAPNLGVHGSGGEEQRQETMEVRQGGQSLSRAFKLPDDLPQSSSCNCRTKVSHLKACGSFGVGIMAFVSGFGDVCLS